MRRDKEATLEGVPVSENFSKRSRRAGAKFIMGQRTPESGAEQNVYFVALVVIGIGLVFNWLYDVASAPEGLNPIWFFLMPSSLVTLLLLIMSWMQTLTHWWHDANHIVVGREGIWSLVDYEHNRDVQAIILRTMDAQGNLVNHIQIFEAVRFGQITAKVLTGDGPVEVSPVKQSEIVLKLDQEYQRTKVKPQLPKERVYSGSWKGGTYVVSADFQRDLLGNMNSIYSPEVRKWIWNRWPDLTPNCKVYYATKLTPEAVDMAADYRTTDLTTELMDKELRYRQQRKMTLEAFELAQQAATATQTITEE